MRPCSCIFHHPTQAKPLVDRWQREGLVYATPYMMNDDYFWYL